MPELKRIIMETSAVRVGAGAGTTGATKSTREYFKKERGFIYKIKHIGLAAGLQAAGAGYAIGTEFQLLRKNLSLDAMINVKYFTGINNESPEAVIWASYMDTSDSYASVGPLIQGQAPSGEMAINYPDGFEPVVLEPIFARVLIRVFLDSVGGRSWYVYGQFHIDYFQQVVSEKEYEQYTRKYIA